MSPPISNPFDPASDPDRAFIWDRLILADSQAFVAEDFSLIENDFDAAAFEGVRCGLSSDPNNWQIAFATLDQYAAAWLAASRTFVSKRFVGLSHLEAVLRRCRIDRIDLLGDRAIAHKKFSGELRLEDGSTLSGDRQTLYRLHRRPGATARDWKIVGFFGQLPLN